MSYCNDAFNDLRIASRGAVSQKELVKLYAEAGAPDRTIGQIARVDKRLEVLFEFSGGQEGLDARATPLTSQIVDPLRRLRRPAEQGDVEVLVGELGQDFAEIDRACRGIYNA